MEGPSIYFSILDAQSKNKGPLSVSLPEGDVQADGVLGAAEEAVVAVRLL